MSVDVEDYFQVGAFENRIDRRDWPDLESRVERNTYDVLDLFDENFVKATFFVLGWVAERHPVLVRDIVGRGHELASHGMAHHRVTQQSPEDFLEDAQRSRDLLEQTAGVSVIGFRAASFSIDASNLWALDVLSEAGYRYSSSIYPIQHDHYGMPQAPRFWHRPAPGSGLIEIPVSTVPFLGRRWPCGGGGYFRLLPYSLSRRMMRRIVAVDRQACVFYFHPWEIDPDQPRIADAEPKARFRHYVNLGRMRGKLAAVMQDFAWDRIDRVFPVTDEVGP